ncbi:cancer susceptibility candidate protein 1 [Pycnococcus provasolii]
MGKKGGGKAAKKAAAAEAARLAAEAEAARLEEERLKREEIERKEREEQERIRAEQEAERLHIEGERLDQEREELAGWTSTFQGSLATSERARLEQLAWERYLKCSHLPNPSSEAELSGFVSRVLEAADVDLDSVLAACEEHEEVVEEAYQQMLNAMLAGDTAKVAFLLEQQRRLRELTQTRLDRVTAHILQHSDEYANDKGECQVSSISDNVRCAIWVNYTKNPRTKAVEFPELDFYIELPKSLALASVALRLTHTEYDAVGEGREADEWRAVGGVFSVDLLSLPPGPKKARGWTVRLLTALAFAIQRLPYPIPIPGQETPADPPPMGVTFPLRRPLALMDKENPKIGWWDAEKGAWSQSGITEVQYDEDTNMISFFTTKLTSLALIQSRTQLFPYRGWFLRPVIKRFDPDFMAVELRLLCGLPMGELVIEIHEDHVLLKEPQLDELKHLLDKPIENPRELLRYLSELGIYLLPEERDATFAGCVTKELDAEEAFCFDLGLLSLNYLLASSKFNQYPAPRNECLARVSEIFDFGRTARSECDKVFTKEKTGAEDRQTVQTYVRYAKGGQLLKNTLNRQYKERRDSYGKRPDEECLVTQVHANPVICFKGQTRREETLEEVETTSPQLVAKVQHTLLALRVASFG